MKLLRLLIILLVCFAAPPVANSYWQSRSQVSVGSVAPPVNTVAPATTTPSVQAAFGVQSQVLTTSNGTWTGSPAFTYQWQRAGSNIVGQTASSYTVQAADDAQAITCIVTGTNGGGNASSSSSNTITGISGTVFLNENFATQNTWASTGGYSFTGNKMVITNSTAFNASNRSIAGMTAGLTYRFIYDFTVSAGNLVLGITSSPSDTVRTTNGTFTGNLVAGASPLGIFIQNQAANSSGTATNILMVQR